MNKKILTLSAALITATFASASQAEILLYADLSNGGEKLAVTTDGTSIKSGGLFQFSAGYRYNINDSTSIDAMIGYKFDQVSTQNNGSADFQRFPLEVGIRKAYNKHNIGGGLSQHLSAKYSGPGTSDIEFKNSTGFYAYYGYEVNTNLVMGLKYTVIEYKSKKKFANISGNLTNRLDGNNLAIFGSYAF